MIKMFSMMAMAGLMAVAVTGASAQESQTFRRITAGKPAALQGAMTEAQARKACQTEMRGARESKKSLRIKMKQCIDQKMQGNN